MVKKQTRKQTVQICWNGTPFEFTLNYKENVELGSTTIRQVWMPVDTLYGDRKRGRLTGNARSIADLFRAYVFDEPKNPSAFFTHLLYLELVPLARKEGSRHYLRDARVNSKTLRQAVNELEGHLSIPISAAYLSKFAETARKTLCPIADDQRLPQAVKQLEERVFGEALSLLGQDRWDEAIESARTEWLALCCELGKKSRARSGITKDAFDVMSWRTREAIHFAYTLVWRCFLQLNIMSIRQTDESYFFHAFWHCFPHERDGNEAVKRPTYFEGHILGLHPAGSVLMRSPRGREIIGRAIVNPDEYFRHLYGAYELALFCYHNALDNQKDGRSKKTVSYNSEFHDLDSDFMDDEAKRELKAMKQRR